MTAVFPSSTKIIPLEFPVASPSFVWIIDHNLGRTPQGLELFAQDGTQIYGAVTNPTPNRTVVTYGTQTGGKATYL